MKKCNRCNKYKSLDLFAKKRPDKEWLRSYCKTCSNQKRHQLIAEKSNKEIAYKIGRRLDSRLYIIRKKYHLTKIIHSNRSILGCSLEELIKYLESRFSSGITWDNYGKVWEIDHIEPLSVNSIDIIKKRTHYTNLQPLLIEEHKIKTKKEKQCP